MPTGSVRMMDIGFRTDDLPVPDRFDYWYELTTGPTIPVVSRVDSTASFHASGRRLALDAVRVYAITGSTMRMTRSARLVRRFDPEHGSLFLIVRGEYRLTHADQVAALGPGDMVFVDFSRPYDGWLIDEQSPRAPWHHVQVQFPRALLPRPALLDMLVGRKLSAQDGVRTVVAGYLRELIKPTAHYRSSDATNLANSTVDLVAALLAHESDTTAALPPQTRDQALLLQIFAFICQRLSDPDLSPTMIAAAHYISTRYLHKLFQTQELTVAAWIRHQRLTRCHRDLGDPGHSAHPIHTIANRWGFTDNAHFSRLFRRTYGISPSDYRRLRADAQILLGPAPTERIYR